MSINERCQPTHRDERYTDPLGAHLLHLGIGEISGAGTMLSVDSEPLVAEIEVDLPSDPQSVASFRTLLARLDAPKGSVTRYSDSWPNDIFGTVDGLGIVLDGTGLDDEVYANSDVNEVIGVLLEELDGAGDLRSWWEGPVNTSLYFYGPSNTTMRDRLAPVLSRFPLCKGAQLLRLTPDV